MHLSPYSGKAGGTARGKAGRDPSQRILYEQLGNEEVVAAVGSNMSLLPEIVCPRQDGRQDGSRDIPFCVDQ